ncbi:MAG TPA: FHA domain-containing protein [Sporichthya sp.]|nr:FHA domain-containing protein [Sporichthya sp.]
MYCSQCGHRPPDDARFCPRCGAALATAGADGSENTSSISIAGLEVEAEAGLLSPGDQAAVDALPTGSALLIVQRGPQSGSRFLLDADATRAGRHPDSDIFLDDVTVSRRHADFHRIADGSFRVQDAGSLNGTYVNRERIEEAVLSGGDEVQIGKYRLVFFASAPGAPGEGAGAEISS